MSLTRPAVVLCSTEIDHSSHRYDMAFSLAFLLFEVLTSPADIWARLSARTIATVREKSGRRTQKLLAVGDEFLSILSQQLHAVVRPFLIDFSGIGKALGTR